MNPSDGDDVPPRQKPGPLEKLVHGKRQREDGEESSDEEDTSSTSSSSLSERIIRPAPLSDMEGDSAMIDLSASPDDSSDKGPSEPPKAKKPKRAKPKKKQRITSGEDADQELTQSSVTTPPKPKSKQKQKITSDHSHPPSSSPVEDITDKTPTQKSKGKQREKAPSPPLAEIPEWLKNSEAVVEKEKAAWEWAPTQDLPVSGFDIPDIMGKEIHREQQVQKMANFMTKYIPDLLKKEGMMKGVWAAHLYGTAKNKPKIVTEAIKEIFKGEYGIAHVPNSIWSLVYSPTGKSIAPELLKGRAIIQKASRRAIVFRSLVLPGARNFKIKEVM